MSARQMHLGAFLMSIGHHAAAWREPAAAPLGVLDLKYYQHLARKAEAGKLDMVFFADRLALSARYENRVDAAVQYLANMRPEPLTLLGALAASTEHIGLAATASTSYNEPYFIARAFATLDHLSSGRAAWNIVTSTNDGEALNFSRDQHFEHEIRYDRADEFVAVVKKLWDSWEDGAFILDKKSGQYADPARVHTLEHRGASFGVRGPLNIARPPQGHPLLIQAGSSNTGRDFAARTADVIFASQPDFAKAQAFHADIQQRLVAHGRIPGSIKILPGVMPIVGATEADAKARLARLEEAVHPLGGLSLLSDSMNLDLSVYPLDEPLPELGTVPGNQSRYALVREISQREGLTLRQLGQRFGGSRSHRVLAGTPEQIADDLVAWFEGRACDGFNLMPATLPDGLDDFVEHVVPLLQKRGVFRRDYEEGTLRTRLGLPHPGNGFAG